MKKNQTKEKDKNEQDPEDRKVSLSESIVSLN